MVNLKEYFFNTNHYSDPIIKKFIYEFTDKFNPFLVIALNKEFLLNYLTEMDEMNNMNEWKVNDDLDILQNIMVKNEFLKPKGILCRVYTYSEGVYEIKEVLQEYYNLSYDDHSDMTTKIQDFQFCIQEIIKAENSKVISKYNILPESKEQDLIETTTKESSYLGQPTNDKANNLFEFLIQYYRPDEKRSVKYVNILHYLKNNSNKELYIFQVKQKDYKEMIIEKTGIEIKKFQKSASYFAVERCILDTLEVTFRTQKC